MKLDIFKDESYLYQLIWHACQYKIGMLGLECEFDEDKGLESRSLVIERLSLFPQTFIVHVYNGHEMHAFRISSHKYECFNNTLSQKKAFEICLSILNSIYNGTTQEKETR